MNTRLLARLLSLRYRLLWPQVRTVFMTSHVLETVERLCDRAAIIKSPGHFV